MTIYLEEKCSLKCKGCMVCNTCEDFHCDGKWKDCVVCKAFIWCKWKEEKKGERLIKFIKRIFSKSKKRK